MNPTSNVVALRPLTPVARARAAAPAEPAAPAPAPRPVRPVAPIKAQAVQGLPRHLLVGTATVVGGVAGAVGLAYLGGALGMRVPGIEALFATALYAAVGFGAGGVGGGVAGNWLARKLADIL